MTVKNSPSLLCSLAVAIGSMSVLLGASSAHALEESPFLPINEQREYCTHTYHLCLLLNREDTEDSLATEHQRLTDQLRTAQARLRSLQSELSAIGFKSDKDFEEGQMVLLEQIKQVELEIRGFEAELLNFEKEIKDTFEQADDSATNECVDNLRACQQAADRPSKIPQDAEIPTYYYDMEYFDPSFTVDV